MVERRESIKADGNGGNQDRSTWNADLAHDKNVKEFMRHSGEFAITTNEFQALHGLMDGYIALGFNLSPVIKVFDSYERRTPDRNGGSRRDGLQLLTPKSNIIVPGLGQFGEAGAEKKEGFLSRWFGWGKDKGAEQK